MLAIILLLKDGSNVYIDVENGSLSWTAPHCAGEGAALSVAEIRNVHIFFLMLKIKGNKMKPLHPISR